jgi:hypothetical protein
MAKTRLKKCFTGLMFLLFTAAPAYGQCLHGKVKVVANDATYKVQVVDAFPDLKVQRVNSFPDKCGQWQFVESFPDFTIQYVTSFPDLKIKYVSSFPGQP